MNDEIKEILDKLKDNNWYEELDLTGTKWIELQQEETNQLLNYITNLQEENEHLRTQVNTYKNIVYKIRNYINAYSPYFLQTQEENNQTIAKIIHEELNGGDEE